jgi:hypothetical protein
VVFSQKVVAEFGVEIVNAMQTAIVDRPYEFGLLIDWVHPLVFTSDMIQGLFSTRN